MNRTPVVPGHAMSGRPVVQPDWGPESGWRHDVARYGEEPFKVHELGGWCLRAQSIASSRASQCHPQPRLHQRASP